MLTKSKKFPGQYYNCFESTSRKWDYLYLNELSFHNRRKFVKLYKNLFFKKHKTACACINMRRFIASQGSILYYNILIHLYSHREALKHYKIVKQFNGLSHLYGPLVDSNIYTS